MYKEPHFSHIEEYNNYIYPGNWIMIKILYDEDTWKEVVVKMYNGRTYGLDYEIQKMSEIMEISKKDIKVQWLNGEKFSERLN